MRHYGDNGIAAESLFEIPFYKRNGTVEKMTRSRFLCLLTVWTSCSLCLAVNPNEQTTRLKALLTSKGWPMQDILTIRENGQLHDMHRLFNEPGRITPGNVQEKIRHVHQYLSCEYSFVLNQYCDYVASSFGQKCKTLDDGLESLICLERFLQRLKVSDPWIVRMIGALSYLIKISPDTVLNKQVRDTLVYLKMYYDTRAIDRSEFFANEKTKRLKVLVRVQDVEDVLISVVRFSHMFLTSNCSLKPGRDNVADVFRSALTDAGCCSTQTIDEIDTKIDEFISKSTASNYEDLGFVFDSTSNTTDVHLYSCVVEIADGGSKKAHVHELAELLSHGAWHDNNSGIVESGHGYPLSHIFGSNRTHRSVTSRTFYEQILQAQQAISCEFARFVKDYVELARSLGLLCASPGDLVDWRQRFVRAIDYGRNQLLTQMKVAFSHVHHIYPNAEFKPHIALILDYVLSYFGRVQFNDPSFAHDYSSAATEEMVSDELQYSQTVLSFAERHSRMFLREFCWPVPYKEKNEGVSSVAAAVQFYMDEMCNSSKTTLDTMVRVLCSISNGTSDFTKRYKDFGFNYDPEEDKIKYI